MDTEFKYLVSRLSSYLPANVQTKVITDICISKDDLLIFNHFFLHHREKLSIQNLYRNMDILDKPGHNRSCITSKYVGENILDDIYCYIVEQEYHSFYMKVFSSSKHLLIQANENLFYFEQTYLPIHGFGSISHGVQFCGEWYITSYGSLKKGNYRSRLSNCLSEGLVREYLLAKRYYYHWIEITSKPPNGSLFLYDFKRYKEFSSSPS